MATAGATRIAQIGVGIVRTHLEATCVALETNLNMATPALLVVLSPQFSYAYLAPTLICCLLKAQSSHQALETV